MRITLTEIAELVGGEAEGDTGAAFDGVAGIQTAGPTDVSYFQGRKLADHLSVTHAGCLLVPASEKGKISFQGPKVWVANPLWGFVLVARIYQRSVARKIQRGIHAQAIVDPAARLGHEVAVLQGAIVEADAEVGNYSIIHPGAYVGPGAKIGQTTILHPGAHVLADCVVGDRCILHAGCVLGSDGYGYVQVEERHEKIPHLGKVVVESDVEIGANVTIDRANHSETRIGAGTKVDNLVQIAHNVQVGKAVLIVAQVGIAGSCEIGDGAILRGQAGLPQHTKIGKRAVVLAKSGPMKPVPDGAVVFGTPARPVKEAWRIEAMLSRLPGLVQDVKKLKKASGLER
ncbi:UDP-3-O-(3-hydroxymyristoyl)glucosamine N-acyltransferase [Rhodococcus xishaensis]|nr:UDP-3-O-(3-hydroxymyristoyl)glucosamine N-acyltransferase [Rhodococcus xishaensis]